MDGDACVTECDALLGQVLNVAGDQCLSECPEFSESADLSGDDDTQICVCSEGFQLNSEETECVDGCENN